MLSPKLKVPQLLTALYARRLSKRPRLLNNKIALYWAIGKITSFARAFMLI